ncbi:MAG: PhzF family phenazine biosynthesis protein [Caulobacteraceae bacterium]|nr:PhzF family phenazine biosynthesis protein [Caulobacteraceae bacterium]
MVERYAAFADQGEGGNPAGVVVDAALPDPQTMQRIAAEVGYSETVFAAPRGDAWRVRYFAPAMEVAFCGHATVALGVALARRRGDGLFHLRLNAGEAQVEGRYSPAEASATLRSPPASSRPASPSALAEGLALFGWSRDDLAPDLPPAIINAGVDHLLLSVRDRETLAAMTYDLDAGRRFMEAQGLTTISLVQAERPDLIHARNPFAAGGVYEDPATGAAAAALGGYLGRIGWPHAGEVTILQGADMGQPCRLRVAIPTAPEDGVRVGGAVRQIV